MQSVLQDWVMKLPLREQGTILTGIRGCDVAPKRRLLIGEQDTAERQLVSYFRFCVMHPADKREVDVPGAFFCSAPPETWRPSQFGHFPQHWYSHLMHCFEVVGYRGPYPHNEMCFEIYEKMARNMHLNVETFDQMVERLSEDRIATGEIVS